MDTATSMSHMYCIRMYIYMLTFIYTRNLDNLAISVVCSRALCYFSCSGLCYALNAFPAVQAMKPFAKSFALRCRAGRWVRVGFTTYSFEYKLEAVCDCWMAQTVLWDKGLGFIGFRVTITNPWGT